MIVPRWGIGDGGLNMTSNPKVFGFLSQASRTSQIQSLLTAIIRDMSRLSFKSEDFIRECCFQLEKNLMQVWETNFLRLLNH